MKKNVFMDDDETSHNQKKVVREVAIHYASSGISSGGYSGLSPHSDSMLLIR